MKHAFNIYPALFILTPLQRAEAALVEGNECNDERAWASEEERYFTSYPQTYWGNCILNASRTQLLNLILKTRPCFQIEQVLHWRTRFSSPGPCQYHLYWRHSAVIGSTKRTADAGGCQSSHCLHVSHLVSILPPCCVLFCPFLPHHQHRRQSRNRRSNCVSHR